MRTGKVRGALVTVAMVAASAVLTGGISALLQLPEPPAFAAGTTTTTAFGPAGYPGTTSTTIVPPVTTFVAPFTTIAGVTTTTVPVVTTTTTPVTTTTVGPSVKFIQLLPDYYFPVTTEGMNVCGYASGAALSLTFTTQDGAIQIGPGLTADSNGCVLFALRYVGNSQFEVQQGVQQGRAWSSPFTLANGQNVAAISGTSKNGSTLTTNVQFFLHPAPGIGNARSVKGKGVSWLSLGLILAMLIDILLFGAGLALHSLSRRRAAGSEFPLGAKDDNDEEEEQFPLGDNEFLGEPGSVPELPSPR